MRVLAWAGVLVLRGWRVRRFGFRLFSGRVFFSQEWLLLFSSSCFKFYPNLKQLEVCGVWRYCGGVNVVRVTVGCLVACACGRAVVHELRGCCVSYV